MYGIVVLVCPTCQKAIHVPESEFLRAFQMNSTLTVDLVGKMFTCSGCQMTYVQGAQFTLHGDGWKFMFVHLYDICTPFFRHQNIDFTAENVDPAQPILVDPVLDLWEVSERIQTLATLGLTGPKIAEIVHWAGIPLTMAREAFSMCKYATSVEPLLHDHTELRVSDYPNGIAVGDVSELTGIAWD